MWKTKTLVKLGSSPCADPESFFSKGSNFFFVNEWKYTTTFGPSSARQLNAISMAFRWRADDGPTLNAGLVAL